MKKLTLIALLFSIPVACALTVNINQGEIITINEQEILTNFGMIIGTINFKIGNYKWPPSEIWLLPEEINPSEFSKGLTQKEILEIPKNLTFSTCRTAVYFNETLGKYGFKIYNTGTTQQILENGTFCGLAYNGTYWVIAKYG
ncbi:MAG: hypothetical protein QW403_03405 [Candidatus Aenigmatarchaeota archaeon]